MEKIRVSVPRIDIAPSKPVRRSVLPVLTAIGTTLLSAAELATLVGCGPISAQVEMIPTPDFWNQQTENTPPIRSVSYTGEELKLLPQSTSQLVESNFGGKITQAMIFEASQKSFAGYIIDESQNNAPQVSSDLYFLSNGMMVGAFLLENGQTNFIEVVGVNKITSDGYVYQALDYVVNENGVEKTYSYIALGYGQVKTPFDVSTMDENEINILIQSQIEKGEVDTIVVGNPFQASPNVIVWMEDLNNPADRKLALADDFSMMTDGGVLFRMKVVEDAQDIMTPTPIVSTKTPSPVPSETPKPPTSTVEPSPTSTPEPVWLTTIKIQDPEGQSFKIENGQPVIDIYDTQTQEKIVLNQESIKITTTTDGLNPNILTALDADGNTYAFNPDYGWFKVPEVQMNYANLKKYTEVEQDFIEDGRANITTALKYAENPTISPDAVAPQYWANYGADGGSNFVYLSYTPSGHYGLAQKKWPDLITYFKPENKPFTLTGFYKVHLKTGETIYVDARTIKTGDNQTTNLFYGFDKQVYETMANTISNDGTQELKICLFVIGDRGGDFFAAILAPPETDINGNPLRWNPDLVHRINSPNPDVAKLQKRRELISLFSAEDQKTILNVLSQIQVEYEPGKTTNLWTAPLNHLPPELSKYILLPGISD